MSGIFKKYGAAITGAAMLGLAAGCVPVAEQDTLQKDVHYLMAVNEGLRTKVAELQKNAVTVSKGVENLEKGLASLVDETRSSVAESNAELDKFREEFGIIRGGVEDTDFIRQRVIEDVDRLKRDFSLVDRKLDDLKRAAVSIQETSNLSDEELRKFVNGLGERLATLNKAMAALEDRIIAVEAKADSLAGRVSVLEPEEGGGKAAPAPVAQADPDKLYMTGYRQITDKNYVEAIESLRNFIKAFPTHEFSDNAQYWIGEAFYATNDYERAVLEFNRVIRQYATGDKVAAAKLKQGFAFLALGSEKEGRLLLERVIADYPNTPEADEAANKLKALSGSKPATPATTPVQPAPVATPEPLIIEQAAEQAPAPVPTPEPMIIEETPAPAVESAPATPAAR
jgi:tol-pal system protein YbgF